MANSTSGDSLIERADRILGGFDAAHRERSLAQIGEDAELPRSTVHRMVRQLAELGWLTRTAPGRYAVGTRLWVLGSSAPLNRQLSAVAKPYLSDAHAVLRQHIQLGIIEGQEVLVVERIAANSSVRLRSEVAGRLPLHQSATGLMLLAGMPRAFVADYLEILRRASLDPSVAAGMVTELRRFRAKGYAIQRGLIDEETCGVAVPVAVENSAVPVALGTVMNRSDLPPEAVHGVVNTLRVAAHGIERAARGSA
ncbi:IclR family transcriptional regulator [Curtobacterium sp. S6]|uniref:IclR family transcriptional regulator n=1 Tax=Curtobacterium sp. S6 TaxID=1479623 RepID=UPI00068A9E31|nr:IclR family transcriptional regulator [Curtobacterium sp. S6]